MKCAKAIPKLCTWPLQGGGTYQWLRNGTIIPGATASSYTTSVTGNYAVVVNNGICSETVAGPSVITPPLPVVSFNPPDMLYTSSFAGYQWFRNGVLIPGATGNTLHETGGGVYTVVVTDSRGCSDTSSGYSVGGTTGLSGVSGAQNISIYPNPATSVVHIDAPVTVNVSILSIDGKVLMSQENATDIDISKLADGMYMILVYDQSGMMIKSAKLAKLE